MKIEPQKVPEVLLLTPKKFGDERGFFSELLRVGPLTDYGVPPMLQHNLSRSSKGVLRGLHYQLRAAPLGKLVRCLAGRIFDVAVDVRRSSPTYGHWVGAELNGESLQALYVPEGFAHGFCALTDTVDVLYMQTGYYSPEHERGVIWNDPDIGIDWPVSHPTLSSKDSAAPRLTDAENDF